MLSDVGGWGLVSVQDVQSFFLIKKTGFVPWPGIMLSQTLIYYWQEMLLFLSDFRQWSHHLLISLRYLWAKSKNRVRGQFECDVAWFCFWFDFVGSNAQCSCCSTVCLRFQVVQIKQLVAKWALKIWIIINKIHFVIFLNKCTRKSIEPRRSKYWGFS